MRRQLRASPAQWKLYKQRRARSAWTSRFALAWGLFAALGLLFAQLAEASSAQATLMRSLIFSALACWRATGLAAVLADDGQRLWLAFYPCSPSAVFNRKLRRWLWSGWWTLLVALTVYWAENRPGTHSDNPGQPGLAIGLEVVLLNSLAVLLASPQHRGKLVAAGCVLGLGGLLNPLAWVKAEGLLVWTRWLWPTGWVESVSTGVWLWLGPAVLLVAAAAMRWRRLVDQYSYQPAVEAAPPATEPAWDPEADAFVEPPIPAQPAITPLEHYEIEQKIRRGEAFAPLLDQPIGRLDRLLWRWLSPAQRGTLGLMTNDMYTWLARDWRRSAVTLGLGLLLGLILPPQPASWSIGIATFISGFMLATPNTRLPLPFYPLRFWGLIGTTVKVTLFQLLLWTPLAALAGVFVAWKWHGPLMLGLFYGLKLPLLGVLLLPIGIVGQISGGTNDSSSRHCALRFALVAIPVAIVMLIGGLAFLLVPDWWCLAGLGPATMASWLFLWRYGAWFNRMKFDLMPKLVMQP